MTKPNDYFAGALMAEIGHKSSLRSAFLAQDLSAKVGFDFSDIDIVKGKVEEEVKELVEAYHVRDKDPLHFAEELGDCLFALVNLARWSGLDPDTLLDENTLKYARRCAFIEAEMQIADKQWRDLSPSEIFSYWKAAKKSGL